MTGSLSSLKLLIFILLYSLVKLIDSKAKPAAMLFHSQFCCRLERKLMGFLSDFKARHRVTEASPILSDTNLETPSQLYCFRTLADKVTRGLKNVNRISTKASVWSK